MLRYRLVIILIICALFVSGCGCSRKTNNEKQPEKTKIEEVVIDVLEDDNIQYEYYSDGTENIYLPIGEVANIYLRIFPGNLENKNAKCYSTDTNIVAINKYQITGKLEGTTKIYCVINNIKSNFITLNIK